MKPSDMQRKPLKGKPKGKLVEIGRSFATSDGWETVIYKGLGGQRYEVTVKDNVERNWVAIPKELD